MVTKPRRSHIEIRCFGRHWFLTPEPGIATPGHLRSCAKCSPGIDSGAGKNKGNGSSRRGERYLARVFGGPLLAPAGPTPSLAHVTGASTDAVA